MNKIENIISKHYSNKVGLFGGNHKGMGWSSKKDQYLRFKELIKFFDLNNAKIHDFGCGNGEFIKFIKKNKIKYKKYYGTDISEEMISLCKKTFKNSKKNKFLILNNLKKKKNVPIADFVLASGIFNIKKNISKKVWQSYFFNSLKYMFSKCKNGISFNVLTFDTTFKNPNNFYPNLEIILKFCRKELSKKIIINHSYNLWEYTVFIFKK